MVMREGETQIIPESVLESMSRTLTNLEELNFNLLNFLEIAQSDVLAEMEPLQRAHALLMLAKAISTLFTLRLRCTGVHPDDHPVKTELERLRLYHEKLERFDNWNKAPLRPSTIINPQAAARVIEHSLPDLTAEQKQCMQEVSRRKEGRSSFHQSRSSHKKRKCGSSNRSIGAAAQEFLEKATRELLGATESDVKGPLRRELE